MIVCSCNVFTDGDVRTALASSAEAPRNAGDVYECLGCTAQCGRCIVTIRLLMAEVFGATCGVQTAAASALTEEAQP